MSNKQTALDWYIQEIDKYNKEPWKYVTIGNKQAIIDQAKEMEKEQIENAFDTAYSFNHNVSDPSAQEYYNKTYEQ